MAGDFRVASYIGVLRGCAVGVARGATAMLQGWVAINIGPSGD